MSGKEDDGSTCEIWRRYKRLTEAYSILLDGARQAYNAIQLGLDRPEQASRAAAVLHESITAARLARGTDEASGKTCEQ